MQIVEQIVSNHYTQPFIIHMKARLPFKENTYLYVAA